MSNQAAHAEQAEPPILEYGRSRVSLYAQLEYEQSLRRAFVDRRADFIVLDSCRTGQGFLAPAIAYCFDLGWLYCSQYDTSDEQSSIAQFRLTDAGKKFLGIDK